MIEKSYPLVSVVVITYNSSEFIIECLDSIKAQTYQNIELIISDDCSPDETVSICKEWLLKNKERFVNTELIEVSENTGITKNINRGCKAAKGAWIKPFAGDDILLSKCIEKNIQHCDGKKILFSQVEIFDENRILGLGVNEVTKYFFSLTAKQQFEKLYLGNFVNASSGFINSEYLKNMNYFNEFYKMVEDYPFWLVSTYNGIKLHFFDDVTVRYRLHEKSISSNKNVKFNVEMFKFEKLFYTNFLKQNDVSSCLRINRFFILLIQEKIIIHGNDLKAFKKYSKLKYLNICNYLGKIKRKINK